MAATGQPSHPTHWHGMDVLALGTHRLCVRDPAAPGICLKFERPLHERPAAGVRQRLRRWLAGRWPRFGENHAELRAQQVLRRHIGNGADAPFAACHGIVATSWGDALRCECVLLADGQPARSLHFHLQQSRHRAVEPLCEAVTRFEAWLIEHRVPLFDLNPGNFVVVPDATGLRLVCVDAKSIARSRELLPLSRWIGPLRRRKIRRRAQRLRLRIRRREDAALATAAKAH